MTRRQSVHEQSTVVFHPELLKVENSLNSISGRLTSRVTLGWTACEMAWPYGSDSEASAANPSRAEAGCVLWRRSIKKQTTKVTVSRWTNWRQKTEVLTKHHQSIPAFPAFFSTLEAKKCEQLRIPLAEFWSWQTENKKFQGEIKCNLPRIYWDKHLVAYSQWGLVVTLLPSGHGTG